MVNIKDVAKQADVAISTVSRVLNNKDKVSEKTRKKVLRVVKELDYRPNIIAQNLKRKHTNTIGIVIEEISIPHATEIIKGLDSIASKANQNLFLCDGDSSRSKIIKHMEVLTNRQVDGIVLSTGMGMYDEIKEVILKAQSQGIPVVLVSMDNKDLPVASVRASTAHQAETITNYLLELGHKRIGIIGNYEKSFVARGNIEMYAKIMIDRGIFDESLIKYCAEDFEGKGKKYIDTILDNSAKSAIEFMKLEKPPSAIYAVGDLIMMGVEVGLSQIGAKIPDDISIIACCTPDFFTRAYANLTYLTVPCFELGQTAMTHLLGQIKEQKVSGKMDVILNGNLIVKNSCKKLN
ncbi:MAG: LacI family DNA-binding transcriptional regulator [Lachnospirales bacterium]